MPYDKSDPVYELSGYGKILKSKKASIKNEVKKLKSKKSSIKNDAKKLKKTLGKKYAMS